MTSQDATSAKAETPIADDLFAWADEIEKGWSKTAATSIRLSAAKVAALESSTPDARMQEAVEAKREWYLQNEYYSPIEREIIKSVFREVLKILSESKLTEGAETA